MAEDTYMGPLSSEPDGVGLAALEFLYRFVAAVELTPNVAVHSCDRDGTIRYWNKRCETLFGVPASEALGRQLSSVVPHPGHGEEFGNLITHVWDSGEVPPPRDWLVKRADGSHCWVHSSHYAMRRDGFARQVLCMEVDVTARKVLEETLRRDGDKFRQLFDGSDDAIILLRDDHVVDANPAALRLFRCAERDGLVGRSLLAFSPEEQSGDAARLHAGTAVSSLPSAAGAGRFELQYRRCNGELFFAEVLLTPISLEDEQLSYAVIRDASARQTAQQTMLMAAQVFERSRDAILLVDRDHRVLAVNPAFSDMTGFASVEVVGKPLPKLQNGPHESDFYQPIWDCLADQDHWEGEIFGRRNNHAIYPVHAALTAIRSPDGELANYIVILTDITNRRRTEEHTRHLAEHDFLTDLPNRVLFLDRVHQGLATARRGRTRLALMFVDLDRFKHINDTLGHQTGDAVLRELARRMSHCVRSVDTVSRYGGDEFTILLTDIRSAKQAAHVAATLLQALAQPVALVTDEAPGLPAAPAQVGVSASIGIAMFPGDGEDADTLIRHADIAMYHAKQAGRNGFQFFSVEMNAHVVERVEMENRLRQALENHEFVLEYQPEIDIATGQITGVEALIRWRHPECGLLQPEQFIAAAEASGLMVPIGEWVLLEACRQALVWHAHGFPVVVAVNLSRAQFVNDKLTGFVDAALAASNLEARYLDLEITEAVFIDPDPATVATISALRARGVQLTVDDFGTGYSSLSSLRRYPLSKLKIDRSFIQDLLHDTGGASVIPAIIAVARSLNLRVIAEGVEHEDQLRYLERLGCDAYQGFYGGPASRDPDLTGRRR